MATTAAHGLNEYCEKYLAEYTTTHPNVVLAIGRSKNDNIVVYEFVADTSSGSVIQAYWLDIDPKYIEANRKKGKTDDRVELGMMESSMAYGVKTKPVADNTWSVTMVAIPDKTLTLRLVDGRPQLITSINGKDAVLTRVFVATKEGWLKPTVLHVDFFGTDPDSGEAVTERVNK